MNIHHFPFLFAPLRLCVFASTGAAIAIVIAISPSLAADIPAGLNDLGARTTKNAAGEVTAVDLSNAWLSDADVALLAQLPKLESINLSYTKITDLGLEHLAPLQNVKHLDLYYAEAVTDLGIAHLKHWKNLEYLNVRGTKVTSSLFEHVANMSQLAFLDVGHSRVNDDLFEALDSLPRLAHLSFGGNKMSGVALPLLNSFPALKSLSVAGQQRTDSGLWSVAVSDFNVAQIAQIGRLEVLDLGGTGLTDRGVAELAKLKNLQTLDLHGTRVTGKGLAALAVLPHLRHLKLWQARGIDDTAVPALLEMKALTALELPETGLTAGGLLQLSAHPSLKQLYLGGLALSPDQLAALRQALPNCQISWWQKPQIEGGEPRRRGN
jgi:internalin A